MNDQYKNKRFVNRDVLNCSWNSYIGRTKDFRINEIMIYWVQYYLSFLRSSSRACVTHSLKTVWFHSIGSLPNSSSFTPHLSIEPFVFLLVWCQYYREQTNYLPFCLVLLTWPYHLSLVVLTCNNSEGSGNNYRFNPAPCFLCYQWAEDASQNLFSNTSTLLLDSWARKLEEPRGT